MGSGSWSTKDFAVYTSSTKGCSLDAFEKASYSAQELYKSRGLSPVLNPYNIMRECVDSEEHPNTFPVILALDVTGSMGGAAVKVAQKLNEIMTELYADESLPDIEFCIMGIGDLAYDDAPIQMSQFESDVRIAEQLDAIYFERGGGGNSYESYTAAWYMGVYHCQLDCWKRGKKGIIITLGDECPNPYLPINSNYTFGHGLNKATGDNNQNDVETKDLYELAKEKYDIYHIGVDDKQTSFARHDNVYGAGKQWRELLGDNYKVCNLDILSTTIIDIIKNNNTVSNEITW